MPFLSFVLVSMAPAQGQPTTIHREIQKQAANAPLSLQFQGKTAKDCEEWQQSFSKKLRELLGPHRPPGKWEAIAEGRVVLKDHVREQWLLRAEGHPDLPLYLLIPKAAKKKCPGILAIHGHGNYGYQTVAGRDDLPGVGAAIKRANYDYGRQLVRQGYIVAVPCLVPFGRRIQSKDAYGKQDPCAVTFVRLQLLGRVLMAENLRDCLWAIEMLSRHRLCDAERIGCVGLSYGGRMTMLTSALEPRIKAAVISGALNVMQERVQLRYSCGAQVIPGLLKYGDVPEISSLIAPRPVVFEVGSRDGLIKPEWAQKALHRIGNAYKTLGAEKHLHVDRFEGGHRWNGKVADAMLKKVLMP